MNFCMEHKREATGCYFIYTYLCVVYVDTYTWTHSEIEQSLPRCCTRFFKRVPFIQSTIIYVYIRVCMQTFFSPNMRAIFLQLACKSNKKKKEGEGKTYFDMRNSGDVSSPATRVAQRFLIIVNDRGMPPPSPPPLV